MQTTDTPLVGPLGAGGPAAEAEPEAEPGPTRGLLAPPAWRRALRALRRLLFGGGRRGEVDLGLGALPVLDVEAILAAHGVREWAVENAAREIPASADTELDGPQSLLVQHVETAIRAGKNRLEGHLSGLTRRIEQADVTAHCNAALATPAALGHDLDALVARHRDRMAPLRERYRSLRAELDAFKARRGIRWEPSRPASHFLLGTVLVAAFCAEAIMNGVYFAEASEAGLLGGVATAGTIAAVNIGVSFFLGRAVAWIRGSLASLRIVGVAALVVFVAWLLGYNLVVAHARDQLVAGASDPSLGAVLAATRSDPLGLAQLNSWLLFLLGSAFSLVALYEGARWDDPNPGYTKRHRRVAEAREDYLALRDGLEAEGRALAKRHAEALALHAERARYGVDALRNDLEQTRLLTVRAQNFFEYAQGTCNTLLSVYRDLNRQQRRTPPPAYFQTRWSHPVPEIFRAERAPGDERLRAQEAQRRELESRRQGLAQEIEAAHARFVERARALRESLDDGEGAPPSGPGASVAQPGAGPSAARPGPGASAAQPGAGA